MLQLSVYALRCVLTEAIITFLKYKTQLKRFNTDFEVPFF